ncbi:MAG TPA: hypothetical protein VD735_02750 [Candidatus Saccharimonadales bacterium]|nr:hypothetical protein [Candidatus Saccharimonadales bacterium]
MLQLSESLLNRPVLSLRAGGTVATATEALINPNNLKIEGFYCQDIDRRTVILLYQDIRDIIPQGFIVNDLDVLAEPSELVRLKELMDIRFSLLGKPVVTVSKEKLGKVSDFATETTTMYIQKLYVSQSLLKNITSGNLGIDRNQIVEITEKQIIVQDLLQPTRVPAGARATA